MPARTAGAPVIFSKAGPVAVITLNRPRWLNAYNVAMRDALHETLQAVRDDSEVRAAVLRGNGRAFCTGGDVREFGTAPSPVVARAVRWQRDVWGLLRSLPKPTIAAVHGYTVGGGLEMALLCDLCIAAPDARFAYPETGLGMIPGVGGTQTTPRLIGMGQALDLLLTGRWIDARTAQRMGWVCHIVPRVRLAAAAIDYALQLCQHPAALVERLKRALNDGLDLPLAQGLIMERRLASSVRRSTS
jgi:enoyl-CoA hydratase/carnithine racemase